MAHADPAELDRALAAGALVVVPNHRSSQQLQDAWSRRRMAADGGKVWRVPAIQAIDLWFASLWQALSLRLDEPKLGWHVLQGAQELLLWREVIAASPAGAHLVRLDGTAAAARDAWRLLQQARLTPADLRAGLSFAQGADGQPDDRQSFFEWLDTFLATSRRRHVLGFADTLEVMLGWAAEHPDALRAVLPPRLMLHGFDAPPPLYRDLLAAFAGLGLAMETLPAPPAAPALRAFSFHDRDAECRAVAEWTRATLAADPAASIGIVCPALRAAHPALERSFGQAFSAAELQSVVALPALRPLAEMPFIATALQLLELNQGSADSLLLCQLLRSPWLVGAAQEADARAELERWLRRGGELRTRLALVRERCLAEGEPTHAPLLGAALREVEQLRLRQRETQSPRHWLRFFTQEWLHLLDAEALRRSGRHAAAAWVLLQEKLAESLFLFEPCTLAAARSLVATVARESSLPGTNGAAPVQILGPVESAGMQFTHLWCMGMSAQHWPGESHPDPWLPLQLQKEHGMPGTDPEASLAEARRQVHALLAATQAEAVFSHALLEDDLPQRPSALLPAGLAIVPVAPDALPAALHPAVALVPARQARRAPSPMLVPLAPVAQQGPGALLADQAACPFKAFAVHRLGARPLEEFAFGLSPAALGNLVHRALEHFWNGLQNSRRLHALGADELEAVVAEAVAHALRDTSRRYPHTLTPGYAAVQQEHLTRLLLAWTEQERRRGHFSVLGSEERLQWRFGQLALNLRIDRIDRAEDGSTVVLDYKTGRVASVAWEDERQDAPQLPLYQQAVEQEGRRGPVSALLYARVNLEEVKYSGIGADDTALPGIAFGANRHVSVASWDELKAHWRITLEALAQEFLAGHAEVRPHKPQSCQHCHLHPFCRIAEQEEPA